MISFFTTLFDDWFGTHTLDLKVVDYQFSLDMAWWISFAIALASAFFLTHLIVFLIKRFVNDSK